MLRQGVEFFVCLSLAVILFKAFLIEGYVITTGSMAPTLLGYHKQITCPSCGAEFALGISNGKAPERATCPNCDQASIDTTELLPNDGDQVLVNKSAYAFRWPRRWEVTVFRNPNNTDEAYVKRVVGLPGEMLQIQRGDVFVDGEIARKSLETQRGLRILVHDHAHQPPSTETDWQPRWTGDQPFWQPRGSGYAVDTRADQSRPAQMAWLTYRHWIRTGGKHLTRLKMPAWPANTPLPWPSMDPVRYEAGSGELVCRGAMALDTRDRLKDLSTDRKFLAAVEQLYTESHIAPLTDFYAYNRQIAGNGDSAVVRDLMLSTTVDFKTGQGELRIEMNDGVDTFTWILNTKTQQVELLAGGRDPVRVAALPKKFLNDSVLLEMSLFDRQVLCALDGKLVFEPWALPLTPPGKTAPRRQVRIGADGIRLHVMTLRLYRDVYYTAEGNSGSLTWTLRNSASRPEFFVLGDNSPVSVDTRLWDKGKAVTPQLLMGKPFLVHLPARTTSLKLGNWQGRLRVPDLSRIRYIR
ncbi:MAG: peptidase and domain protein [Planctomycetaceae bacterium]|nr:peptidase and domain protein [Planctomycetaceae bacterium]